METVRLPLESREYPGFPMPDDWQCIMVKEKINRTIILFAGPLGMQGIYPKYSKHFAGLHQFHNAKKHVCELCGFEKQPRGLKLNGIYPRDVLLKEFK